MTFFSELRDSRELLLNLTMREVRGQYKRTIFGQLWSLANPVAQMIIYTFVFAFIFRVQPSPGDPSGLNVFPIWLMCGLLPWVFFSSAINRGLRSVTDNEALVLKVAFNRIVLPISSVGSVVYNWGFEMLVLLAAILIAGGWGILPWLPIIIFAMALLVLFSLGIGMMLSIANVHFLDTQYLVPLLMNFWMYLTPVMYPISMIADQSAKVGPLAGTKITLLDIYCLNPMERFVAVFRNLMYDNRFPSFEDLSFILICSIISLILGVFVFRKNQRKLAELL